MRVISIPVHEGRLHSQIGNCLKEARTPVSFFHPPAFPSIEKWGGPQASARRCETTTLAIASAVRTSSLSRPIERSARACSVRMGDGGILVRGPERGAQFAPRQTGKTM